MIWQSIALMTAFDVVLILTPIFACIALMRNLRCCQQVQMRISIACIVAGATVIGVFYAIDLFTMYILPVISSRKAAHDFMTFLHLELHWYVSALALTLLLCGVFGVIYRLNSIAATAQETVASLKTSLDEKSLIETDLRAAFDKAQIAERNQREFLSNISHEIRTPLNGVIGMAQVLKSTELTPVQQKYVGIINDAGDHLLLLLNNVLDLSKIDAGKTEIEKIEFSPSELLAQISNMYSPKAIAKGLEIHVNSDENSHDQYVGDPTKIKQILGNLISNAIKFTHSGCVSISTVVREEDECATLKIIVTDTGVGIPSDKLERIFEPFRQADASITRKFGGSGLGLSIVKSLAIEIGGSIRVNSAPGKGARFEVTLPVAMRPSAAFRKSA